jgi:hypothetical protein
MLGETQNMELLLAEAGDESGVCLLLYLPAPGKH